MSEPRITLMKGLAELHAFLHATLRKTSCKEFIPIILGWSCALITGGAYAGEFLRLRYAEFTLSLSNGLRMTNAVRVDKTFSIFNSSFSIQ